jgi:hypothetical protein
MREDITITITITVTITITITIIATSKIMMERTVKMTTTTTTTTVLSTTTTTTEYGQKMLETIKQQRGGVNHGWRFLNYHFNCLFGVDIVVLIRLTSL